MVINFLGDCPLSFIRSGTVFFVVFDIEDRISSASVSDIGATVVVSLLLFSVGLVYSKSSWGVEYFF